MEKAVALFEGWAREKLKSLPGARLEVVRLPGRTPLILIEVPGTAERHHPDVWPSRQAAGNERLGRRHRALGRRC